MAFLGHCSIRLFHSGKILISEPVSNAYYAAYERAVIFALPFLPDHLCASLNQTFISNMGKLDLCRLSWEGESSALLQEVGRADSDLSYDWYKPFTLKFSQSSGESRI